MTTHPLKEAFPDPEVLLSLSPEELAGALLPILKAHGRAYIERVDKAIMEAWSWMIAAGLLATHPRQMPGHDIMFLTRRALAITDQTAFEAFKSQRVAARASASSYRRARVAQFHPGRSRHRCLPSLQTGRGGGAGKLAASTPA